MANESKTLHKHETFIQEVENGYLFVNQKDGIVRYRSDESHEEHVESTTKFVEPAKPILSGRPS